MIERFPMKRAIFAWQNGKMMIGRKLPAVFWMVFAVWGVIQVCLVVKYWDMPNHDDALRETPGIRIYITSMKILFLVRDMLTF